MPTRFVLNGRRVSVEAPPDVRLLWILREELKLTGTKFGCGAGLCGACMVHVEGARAFSCLTTLAEVAGKRVTTIEGLSAKGDHPVQTAWIEEHVPQCGYCQSGQIMSAAALLAKTEAPTREEVVDYMSANLCRCGAYPRIVRAVERAAKAMRS
jgi:isoquinoline 1-oxidoreductase subunit alpha